MTDQHPPQSFFDKLQASVTMRPRWRFWLDHVTIGAAVVLVAVGLVYIGSFITFLWRRAHFSALPSFGADGYGVFFRVFPWWHLLFIIAGIAAFVYLIRRHTQLYRWPLAVTIGVFLLAFLFAALVTDTTRFHDSLTNRAINGQSLPFIGPFYRGQMGLTRGIVTPVKITKTDRTSLRGTTGHEVLTVAITRATNLPNNWNPAVGDDIVVIGQRRDDTITAIAIHQADELPDRQPFRIFRDGPPPMMDAR